MRKKQLLAKGGIDTYQMNTKEIDKLYKENEKSIRQKVQEEKVAMAINEAIQEAKKEAWIAAENAYLLKLWKDLQNQRNESETNSTQTYGAQKNLYKLIDINDSETNSNEDEENDLQWEDELLKQDELAKLIFEGRSDDGSWTQIDQEYYENHRDDLFRNPSTWVNNNGKEGLPLFYEHVQNLSRRYDENETEQLVRDFSLMFAGIPSQNSWVNAAIASAGGPPVKAIDIDGNEYYSFLNYSNNGLPEVLLDEKSPEMNQTHHYVGSFYMGYYTFKPAEIINFAREFDLKTFSVDNKSDITLGNIGIEDGAAFRFGTDDRLYNNRSGINAYKNSDLAEFVAKLMEDK